MKHKLTIAALALCLLFPACSRAEQNFSFSVAVKDEEGNPVPDAHVSFAFSTSAPPPHDKVEGFTDGSGSIHLTGKSTDLGFVQVKKPGYYNTTDMASIYLKSPYHNGRYGDWEPKEAVIELVIKPRRNPVAMYVKREWTEIKEGVDGKLFNYDLEMGDFLPPFGQGKRADLVLNSKVSGDNPEDVKWSLDMEFPNKGDGIQEIYSPIGGGPPQYRGSQMRSPTEAPLGGYMPRMHWEYNGGPNQDGSKDYVYIFRVRTILDEKGEVVSALYGKMHEQPSVGRGFTIIRGKPQMAKEGIGLTYYLNPAGTRSLENDPKKEIYLDKKP